MSSYAITPDSRTVYFTAEDVGSEKLFSVRIGGGTVQALFDVERHIHQSRDSRAGRKVMLFATGKAPARRAKSR